MPKAPKIKVTPQATPVPPPRASVPPTHGPAQSNKDSFVKDFLLPGVFFGSQAAGLDAVTYGSPFWRRMEDGTMTEYQKYALGVNALATLGATRFYGQQKRMARMIPTHNSAGKLIPDNVKLLNGIRLGAFLAGEGSTLIGLPFKYLVGAQGETAEATRVNAEANKEVAKAYRNMEQAIRNASNALENLSNTSEKRIGVDLDIAKLNEVSAQNEVESSKNQVEAAKIQAAAAKYLPYAITGIGGLGLLLAGLGIKKYITSKPAKPQGSIRIKMPGKKGDPESTAEVELPLNMPKMSPSLVEGLDRAVRLRTRKNIRANSYKKDPETGKLIPYDEWEEKYGKNGEKLKNPPTDSPLAKAYGSSDTMPNSGLPKAASVFDNTEAAGSAANTVALYFLGKQFGSSLNAATGKHLSDGGAKTVAGLLAALAPSLIGHLAGELLPARSVSDQIVHDSQGHGILNYTLPGYAAYQAARRNKAYAIENQSKNALGIQENQSNKTNKSYDDDDDDYDWDKEASMQPSMRTGQRKKPEGPLVDPGRNLPAPGSIPGLNMGNVINASKRIQQQINASNFNGQSIPNY